MSIQCSTALPGLRTPEPEDTASLDRWWEVYDRASSAAFTYENSGRGLRLPPPYREVDRDNGVSIMQAAPGWEVVGYTLDPPFQTAYDAVAVMFESPSGEQAWWHFRKW